jgi:hypothetical protein
MTKSDDRREVYPAITCGTRKRSVCHQFLESIQRGEERWAIVDHVRKLRHIRTVPALTATVLKVLRDPAYRRSAPPVSKAMEGYGRAKATADKVEKFAAGFRD